MEQMSLPFEEDLESKAKRLFKILEDDRIARLETNQSKWQDFYTLLYEGYELDVYEASDGRIIWDAYRKED